MRMEGEGSCLAVKVHHRALAQRAHPSDTSARWAMSQHDRACVLGVSLRGVPAVFVTTLFELGSLILCSFSVFNSSGFDSYRITEFGNAFITEILFQSRLFTSLHFRCPESDTDRRRALLTNTGASIRVQAA